MLSEMLQTRVFWLRGLTHGFVVVLVKESDLYFVDVVMHPYVHVVMHPYVHVVMHPYVHACYRPHALWFAKTYQWPVV